MSDTSLERTDKVIEEATQIWGNFQIKGQGTRASYLGVFVPCPFLLLSDLKNIIHEPLSYRIEKP